MLGKVSIWRFPCCWRCFVAVVCTVCVQFALAGVLRAELEGTGLTLEQEQELEFADQLLEAGLADYASMVLEQLDLPSQIMAIREIRSLTARGEFEDARAIVADHPGDTQEELSLRLALADGFYAWGRYDEAQELYEAFFDAFPDAPDENLMPFFMSSAYRYAQMMIHTGNRAAAADAYRMALQAGPDRHIERQLQSELAELLMLRARDAEPGSERDAFLAEVQELANNILWVQDLWFGRAIVLLAHMRVLDEDIDGAMQLVDDYTTQLRAIDQALREQSEQTGEDLTRLSPMAQCRYLIGEILHDRALKIIEEGGDRDEALQLLIGRRTSRGQISGAVHHFLNVFIRYPNTSWAPDAGNRFQQVEELLDTEFGRQVQARVTREQWEEVERAQFRQARLLFNQSRFEDAVDSYIHVLNLFPEVSSSIAALGELAACLIEIESYTMADAVAAHLAERFSEHEEHSTEAGNQVTRIATKYLNMNEHARHRALYDVFFEYFPRHPRAILDLQRFAREARDTENYEEALRLYGKIVDNFEGRSAYFRALSDMARIYRAQEDHDRKARILLRTMREMAAADERNHLRVNVIYRLANVLRDMGDAQADRAQQLFTQVRQILTGDNAEDFASSESEQAANAHHLQGALFYNALIDARRSAVQDGVRDRLQQRAQRELSDEEILNNFYRARAIRQFSQLVEQFPESDFAPAALSQVGTLNTFLGRSDEAAEALRRLERDYPDSREAANAVFMIGQNLLEMGVRDDAVDYFARMFDGDTDYPVAQILRAGENLLEAEEYRIALTAFERVIAQSDDRRYVEPARIGKGQALHGLSRYEEAVAWFDQVIEDFPRSGRTITISRTASEANAALALQQEDGDQRRDLFNKAVELMRRAAQFAQDSGVQTQLEVAVARVLERRAEAEARFGSSTRAREFKNEALAAYQTIMMFRDPSDVDVAPHMQEAFSRALPMMIELERWQDVFDDAQAYLEHFPNGRYASDMRAAITSARTRGDITE